MRQLKFTKLATPNSVAHQAEVLQMLQSLPVPAGLSPSLQAAFSLPGLRFIASVAAQHQNQGLSLLELGKAGHAAVIAHALRAEKLSKGQQDNWSWWVQQGILQLLQKNDK